MQRYLSGENLCSVHCQPLNLFCSDEGCQKQGIICAHCQYESHKHPVQPVGALIREIQRDATCEESTLFLLSQIDQVYAECLQELTKVKLQQQQKLLREIIVNYYAHLCKSISKRVQAAQTLLKRCIHSHQVLNQFLLAYEFVRNEGNKPNASQCELAIQAKLEQFKGCLAEFIECIKNENPFEKLTTIFTIEENKRIRYTFNADKMSKDIELVDKNKVKIKDGYSHRIALLDPPIREQNGKTKKSVCTFKICKVSAMVGIGMCYRKKVEDLYYAFSAYSQHGCYFVASNGYTYNQIDNNFNSQIKNWKFQNDDIIKVTLDPRDKKIIFQKENAQPFQYSYQQRSQMEPHFAVVMCTTEQSVEIVYN